MLYKRGSPWYSHGSISVRSGTIKAANRQLPNNARKQPPPAQDGAEIVGALAWRKSCLQKRLLAEGNTIRHGSGAEGRGQL